MGRIPWVVEARKAVYSTQKEWVNALNELGWNVPPSTVGSWESTGFLPISLDPKSTEVVARSLHISVSELLRRQGYPVGNEVLEGEIPSVAMGLIMEIMSTDRAILEKMMPTVEDHFKMVRSHLED
jgi:hypothetical protein